MSSEDEHDHQTTGSKKRRVLRACDTCRRKKVRCDGPQLLGDRCSNCITNNLTCTYEQAGRKRGPPKGYVESLETRLEKMEGLLAKLCPDGDFSHELGGRIDKETWRREKAPGGSSRRDAEAPSPSPITLASPLSISSPSALGGGALRDASEDSSLEPSDDDQPKELSGTLVERLQRLEINPSFPRFMGKSSGISLVQSARVLKNEFAGPSEEQEFPLMLNRRIEYWEISPWEAQDMDHYKNIMNSVTYQFPDPDLIPVLVEMYFHEVNFLLPLLHRPSFSKDVARKLYLRDKGFAGVFLLVCAIGARYVDDQRVRLNGETAGASSGWKWFNQVQMVRNKSLWAPPCLTDLQIYALAVMFLSGSSAPQACWSIAGVGVRYAQDVGVHRKKVYSLTPTPHEELWKRAFWVLITIDRMVSCTLGRPPALQDEDFDVDMPTECDDEYWTPVDPEEAFKQPPDKPSRMACFIAVIKLNQILAFTMRTVYSINKSKVLLGFVGHQWEENIVAELDSALNQWIDSIPDHLRWDPSREDEIYFNQSALLYANYYNVQIIVHRPFIPTPGKQSLRSIPSLAICTNAARSCSHVLDIQQRRTGKPLPYQIMVAFTAGVVILLNIWGGKRSGMSIDCHKEMADVGKCLSILKKCEKYWHNAGRFYDIVCELASVGDLPLPKGSPAPALKRDRNSDEELARNATPQAVPPPGSRSIAGSRRVALGKGSPSSESSQPSSRESSLSLGGAPLPVRSEDLGRIPLHPAYGRPAAAPAIPSDNGMWYAPPHEPMQTPTTQALHYSSGRAPGPAGVETRIWGGDPVYEQMMGALFQTSTLTPTPNGALGGYHTQSQAMTSTSGMGGFNTPGMPPGGAGGQMPMNSDTLAMWSTAPTGFELDDWGSYLNGMSSMGAQQPHVGGSTMLP